MSANSFERRCGLECARTDAACSKCDRRATAERAARRYKDHTGDARVDVSRFPLLSALAYVKVTLTLERYEGKATVEVQFGSTR